MEKDKDPTKFAAKKSKAAAKTKQATQWGIMQATELRMKKSFFCGFHALVELFPAVAKRHLALLDVKRIETV